MEKKNIAFSPPDITEAEIAKVCEVLRSGWITTGPMVTELENKIKNWLGCSGCVCLNSQTASAEMALRILGIGNGDEVIVPAYTYTATASVVCHVGAKLVMVDSQADSLEMDYAQLENAITEKTKAIIPVDLAGIPCDYEKIYEIVNRKKALFKPGNEIQRKIGRAIVVCDAAHAFGAEYMGKKAGSVADFTNFSFHAVKNFTTAEGGAMTWKHIDGIDDEEIYKRARLLSLHGQSKSALDKTKLGSWEYDIVETGYKCNMTDIAAALGLAQFDRYPDLLSIRKRIIKKYDESLEPTGIQTLNHYTDLYASSGHLYITRIPGITEEQRNEIISKMSELGVVCNVHYKPLPMHSAYKELGFNINDFPNAYSHYSNEVSLPLHSRLTDDDIDYIIECYSSVLKEYLK